MAELDRAREDLAAFAAMAGAQLADFQVRALEDAAPIVAVVAPRQSGKSRSLAVYAAWRAFRRPGAHVLLVSASEDASRRLLRAVRDLVAASDLLRGSVVDEMAGLLMLSNGSEVRSVPASERAIRGWSATDLVLDEAALLPEPIFAAALPTVAARPEARVVMASSATSASGPFFDHAAAGERGSEHVCTHRWALSDAAWLTPSWVESMRASMSEVRFRAEMEGVFAGAADALFTPAALDDVTADFEVPAPEQLLPPARLIGGLDLGASHDRSALCGIGRLAVPGAEHPVFAVVVSKVWPAGFALTTGSGTAPGVAEQVAALPCAWDTFVGEASGLGEAVCGARGVLWRLMAERSPHAGASRSRRGPRLVADSPDDPLVAAGLARYEDGVARARRRAAVSAGHFSTRTVAFHPSAESKAAMFSALALLVGQRRLLIRAGDEELRRALLGLRVDLTPGGLERVTAQRDAFGHSDLASALALCTLVRKGRDGWYSKLAALADPGRVRLPEPATTRTPGGAKVRTGAGLELPRRPLIASVAGGQVTDPDNPAVLRGPEDPIPLARRPV